jgi:hypothetical protein
VPAGSLEEDDDVLADAAMCSPERWVRIRSDVMRGWAKFADGRLYHRTVCEKVIEALNSTRLHRFNKSHARLRKDNVDRKKKGLDLLPYPERPAELVLQWPERSAEGAGTSVGTFRSHGFSSEGKEGNPSLSVPSDRTGGNVLDRTSPIAARGSLEGSARDGEVVQLISRVATAKAVPA